jgi:NAD(P)-dependent dehydrogenase (short-subunit alcohol dehydrogenase family)
MSTMPQTFEGKVAIVTGAASGIGFATAAALGAQGARVVLFDCNAQTLREAEARLVAAGIGTLAVLGDVSQEDAARALVARAADSFGRLDVLVNSAALQLYGTVETTSEQDWDRVMAVNLKGAYLTSRHSIPVMRRSGGGAIVNVASVQGSACQANVTAYAVSKGALHTLTRAMAVDHARDGIRVNSVSPGSIDTPALRAGAQEVNRHVPLAQVLERWGEAHPLGRIGRAAEVAALIAFLCSADAGFCTGGDYRVDGGLLSKIGVSEDVHAST